MRNSFFLLGCLVCASLARRKRTSMVPRPEQSSVGEDAILAELLLAQHSIPYGVAQASRSLPTPSSDKFMRTPDEDAKEAWEGMLDALAKATEAMNEASAKAAEIATLDAQCNSGDQEACETLGQEEEAKREWLAKQDTPSWKSAQSAISQVGELASNTWGQAAQTVNRFIADTTRVADLDADCTAGDETACEAMSREEQAKRAWLSKLDAPAWREAGNTISQVAHSAREPEVSTVASPLSEDVDEARRAWFKNRGIDLDEPQRRTTDTARKPEVSTFAPSASEEEARKAWLKKLGGDLVEEHTFPQAAEDVRKASKDWFQQRGFDIDEPQRETMARVAPVPSARMARNPEASTTAPSASEEEAKMAWFKKRGIDIEPNWQKEASVAPAASAHTARMPEANTASPSASEEEAKIAWFKKRGIDIETNWQKEATVAPAASARIAKSSLASRISEDANEARREWFQQRGVDLDEPQRRTNANVASPPLSKEEEKVAWFKARGMERHQPKWEKEASVAAKTRYAHR